MLSNAWSPFGHWMFEFFERLLHDRLLTTHHRSHFRFRIVSASENLRADCGRPKDDCADMVTPGCEGGGRSRTDQKVWLQIIRLSDPLSHTLKEPCLGRVRPVKAC